MGSRSSSASYDDTERTDEYPALPAGGAGGGIARTDRWLAPAAGEPQAVGAAAAGSAAAEADAAGAAALAAARAEADRLRGDLAARDTRVRDLEAQLVLRDAEAANRLEESAVLRRDLESLRSRVESQLEQLYALQSRCNALEALVGAVGTEPSSQAGTWGVGTSDDAGVESARLREDLGASRAEARRLREELDASGARIGGLAEDLGAAEHLIDHLESQLRTLRDVAAARTDDARAMSATMVGVPALKVALPGQVPEYRGDLDAIDPFRGAELPADGPPRLLVRTDPGAAVVHVLGRRTTIGRTRDNTLQIDASYVSRHHAAVFAGPDRTIIQDLGSTNGVHVNGRRVAREELRDGDVVLVGKARFRFAIRPGA